MNIDITITKTQNSQIDNVDFENLPFGRTFSDHMLVAEYYDESWHNLRIEPFHNFTLHPATMAIHYGQAIFEGMKASKMMDGTPVLFRPEMHAHRMNLSAKRMCMPEFPEDWFVEGLKQLIDLDQAWIPPAEGSALYIRPTMIATDEFIGVRPSSRYLFFIITGPVGPYYPKPVRLITEPNYVRAVVGGTGEAKAAGNYGAAMLPSKLAQEKGFDQVLWLDPPAYKTIQECGTMNVFFVIGNKVITPPLNGTILKGITRDSFLQILRTESYDVEEYPLTVDELVDAYKKGQLKEAFGAGTAAVLSHVSEIEHNGFLMKLPDISERKVGHFLKATIDGMRFGRLPDKYGWIVPAHSLVTA